MIRVLTKPNCPACKQTKAWLDKNNLDYTETQLNAETVDWALSQGHKQAPIVVFGETSFSGYSPTDLEALKVTIQEN